MDARKVDMLNIALILLSLMAAFWMPFGLFLFSYAILGPLHYLTEINWLDERSYFSKSKYTPWLLGGFVLLICMGSFFAEGAHNPSLSGFKAFVDASLAKGFFELMVSWVVHLAFLSFVVAVALAAFKDWKFRILIVLLGIAVAYVFRSNNTYNLLVGSMLPTFIHVCIFTGLFMLYGAMKSGSRPGYMAVLVFVLAHLAIAFWPIDASQHFLANASPVKERFFESGFQNVIYQLGLILGQVTAGTKFTLNSELGIRMGIFLAFAYTYHYLNWFSKTSIIRWHEVSKRKLVWALLIWVVSIALYAYNYRVGLLALLFLSLLHVVFEFPLNYISITGIARGLGQRMGLGALSKDSRG
jgi:hypothetical protein